MTSRVRLELITSTISIIQDVAVPYFRRKLLDHCKFLQKRGKYGNGKCTRLAVARAILVARHGDLSDQKVSSDATSLLS